MAHLTKAQLAAKICGDDLETQSVLLKQTKEELLAIYRDSLMMFSSDEEGAADNLNAEETSVEGDLGNVEVMNPVGATSASRSSRKSGVSGKEVSSPRNEGTLNESNALVMSDGQNVAEFSDEDLYARLKEFGVDVGPIVDSTRHLYQKKLAILLRGGTAVSPKDVNGHDSHEDTTNGIYESISAATPAASPEAKNGLEQYSADEETEEGEDEAQPEAVVRKTPTKSASKRSSTSSSQRQSLADKASELRQRFAGASREGERFTPTPRRSIHSYKVTEMSKETMIKTPDGIVTRDIEYRKSTSDDHLDTAKNIKQLALYWAPRMLGLFVLACVVFYGYQSSVIEK